MSDEQLARPDALPERQRLALKLADRFMTDPAGIDDGLRQDLLRNFTPEQVVELTLDIVAWSKQKVLVTLGIDPPVRPDRTTLLTFDVDGRAIFPSISAR